MKDIKGSILKGIRRAAIFTVVFFFLHWNPLQARLSSDETHQVVTSNDGRPYHKLAFHVFPSGGYSPETRIGLGIYGVVVMRLYKSDSITRSSLVDAGTIYTQNQQFYILPSWKIFSPGNKYVALGEGIYQNYTEKFFGIGNSTPQSLVETYRHSLVRVDTKIQRTIGKSFYAGLHYLYENMYDIDLLGPPGLIANNEVTGSRGGKSSGPGFALTYDSRNRILMTQTGSYMDVQTAWFSKSTGSNFNFNLLSIDFRKFLKINKKNVLAGQFYSREIVGDAPFRMLSLLGGPMIMRGYYYGRFRDNDLIAAQVEYRYKWTDHIYTNSFFCGGEVSHVLKEFTIGGIKPNLGMGIRYVYNKEENLDFRLDAGLGIDGNYGLYVTAGEAF